MPAAFSFCLCRHEHDHPNSVVRWRFGANKLPESRTHRACVNVAASVDDDQQVLPHLAAAQRGMRRFSLTAASHDQAASAADPEEDGQLLECAALGLASAPSHCGQSFQSVIPIMINEPVATATGQINGNSSSTPITTARTRGVLFICAKRQPATPIGHLRLAPSSGGMTLQREATPGYSQFGCIPRSR
jgi:hypothetical protein